ncbi:DNA-deoxyinosine glycosylase [Campylobacter geochelonis]|uniref:Mug G:T/U mismatch-specific DNA glycosylase n=1 Tax=Campylobacter geochelonis TaxID=1780362 RepID=A0A128EDU8_9BACT|nr:DNA-deoxyinosine glycosylase [Campylobacter geochelonis]QKF70993.1 stationary phase mismatch/uracil DNA glycosylase [Campylobacter geochelonis]CZE47114.1 Mug G:T/U mismatch-specific DNA glycosylase [Campylobacter geochelonis]CZE50191.1 Mug G:T/U mismatch-specific DNA glycosylase [Campylobacter geochelonis]
MKNAQIHTIKPFFNKDSQILILGSFPSVKSREQNFYYAHPQNRFWRVLSAVFSQNLPNSVEEKKLFLTRHKIALFDSIQSCEIAGSSDASIQKVAPNDIKSLIKQTNITRIYTNGKKSAKIYDKFIFPQTSIKAISLPSTSPANATISLEKLIKAYEILLN